MSSCAASDNRPMSKGKKILQRLRPSPTPKRNENGPVEVRVGMEMPGALDCMQWRLTWAGANVAQNGNCDGVKDDGDFKFVRMRL